MLWTLVLISLIVAHLTSAGRTEIGIARNLAENAAAQAAADGAIYEAIFHLSDPRPDQRWVVDGKPHETAIGSSRVALSMLDEAAWINPNSAPPALMEGLLRAVGAEPETAVETAGAIAEWIAGDQSAAERDNIAAKYRAAGLDYAPPGAPLESIDELRLIRGMTASMVEALRPHLTLFGPAIPNPASVDPVVVAAIGLAGESKSFAPLTAPAGQANSSDLMTVRIRAVAQGPGGARVRRVAVVRIGPYTSLGYAPLAWEDGE